MEQLKLSLKERLDEIDNEAIERVRNGYFNSRLSIEWSMWEKGKAICEYRGVKSQPSWFALEKETGRNHESLKRWYELYEQYPTRKLYEETAQEKAKQWTDRAVKKVDKLEWYQSSESPEWETPQWLFDILNEEFHFDIDVCASLQNHKCEKFFDKELDGLRQSWKGICWMNPPYGREIVQWMEKAKQEAVNGCTIVCLVPARTDTDWWWETCIQGEIRFIKGRLQFSEQAGAPMASAVVVLRKEENPMVVWWNPSEIRNNTRNEK